jgi:hypothetical protein
MTGRENWLKNASKWQRLIRLVIVLPGALLTFTFGVLGEGQRTHFYSAHGVCPLNFGTLEPKLTTRLDNRPPPHTHHSYSGRPKPAPPPIPTGKTRSRHQRLAPHGLRHRCHHHWLHRHRFNLNMRAAVCATGDFCYSRVFSGSAATGEFWRDGIANCVGPVFGPRTVTKGEGASIIWRRAISAGPLSGL